MSEVEKPRDIKQVLLQHGWQELTNGYLYKIAESSEDYIHSLTETVFATPTQGNLLVYDSTRFYEFALRSADANG